MHPKSLAVKGLSVLSSRSAWLLQFYGLWKKCGKTGWLASASYTRN